MTNTVNNTRHQLLIFALLLLAVLTRFIPHPFNFTAIGALALFAGANISQRKYAYLLPISVMLFSDFIIGFHVSVLPVYACFAMTVWIGTILSKKQSIKRIIFASLTSSVIFFLITNLPFWYADLQLYPMSIKGTLQSYQMGLPFFRNQVLGDLFYNALLFGVYHLAVNRKSRLQTQKIKY